MFGALLTVLTAGLLLATPAGAQPPSKLTDHITDSTGVLTDSGRAAVNSAIDRLYRDRHIQLWVGYVDNFSRFASALTRLAVARPCPYHLEQLGLRGWPHDRRGRTELLAGPVGPSRGHRANSRTTDSATVTAWLTVS